MDILTDVSCGCNQSLKKMLLYLKIGHECFLSYHSHSSLAGPCEHGTELLGSIRGTEFHD
jgi:hypothetical protein